MTALSSILVLLATFLAVFLEGSFEAPRRMLGTQIDLLPALVVYASLNTNLLTASLVAVLGGLFFDSLSSNPLGVSVLPLFVAGFLIHHQREVILREQVFAQFLLGLIASATVPALTLLLLLSQSRTPLLGWGSLWQWFVMSLGGAIATPVLFRMFDLGDRMLNYRRITETSFRPDREIRRGRS